jgi:hypothetical protein
VYVGLTVLLGQTTIPVREPNVFATVLVTRIVLSKTVTLPTVAVVVDPAIAVVTNVVIAVGWVSVLVTVATADVLVGTDELVDGGWYVTVATTDVGVVADVAEDRDTAVGVDAAEGVGVDRASDVGKGTDDEAGAGDGDGVGDAGVGDFP